VNCNLCSKFSLFKYLVLQLLPTLIVIVHKIHVIYPYVYQWDAEVCTDICKMCSAHVILLLVVVFITKYEKDKYCVPEGHEVGPSAGINIPIVPGMVLGYHMI
jgi:hypothetical protein